MQQWQFIISFNQLNMFRAIISFPSSGAQGCIYSFWYNALMMLHADDEVELIETANDFLLFHLVGCL
jgi:hypothetical protein